MFGKYKIALLDSSFFGKTFDDDLKQGLKNIKVYVGESFVTEIEEYKAVLSPEKQAVYASNVEFLNRNISLNVLNFASFGEKCEHLNNDIWGVIELLIGLNARFVILTSNQLLIRKIAHGRLNVDIYNLQNDEFIYNSDFDAYIKQLDFTEKLEELSQIDVNVTAGSVLYKEDGTKIMLSDKIRSGLEASLHKVRDDQYSIAKIFKKDKLSAAKFKNLKNQLALGALVDVSWAKFPTEILYFDAERTIPAGFLEDFVSAEENLDGNPLFVGDPFSAPEEYLNQKMSYSVEICEKIVRQVCYLNTFGYYISDFNLGNFATVKKREATLQMWDTDSFGLDSFFGYFFSPEYVESNNHPKYDTTTIEGVIDISNDALYQFVFMILSLGDSPISAFKKKFKYDNEEYFARARMKFFPANVWQHFEEVFRGEKKPSAEALLRQLSIALSDFKRNPVKDRVYDQLFVEVIPGYAEEKKRKMQEREQEAEKKVREQVQKLFNENPPQQRQSVNLPVGPAPKPQKNNDIVIGVIVGIVLLAILGILVYFLTRDTDPTKDLDKFSSSSSIMMVDNEIAAESSINLGNTTEKLIKYDIMDNSSKIIYYISDYEDNTLVNS